MEHKNVTDTNKNKKEYVKPEVTQVELVADEAVLAACKTGIEGECAPDLSCITVIGS